MLIFSSPEHKVLNVSYCDRPKVKTFKRFLHRMHWHILQIMFLWWPPLSDSFKPFRLVKNMAIRERAVLPYMAILKTWKNPHGNVPWVILYKITSSHVDWWKNKMSYCDCHDKSHWITWVSNPGLSWPSCFMKCFEYGIF